MYVILLILILCLGALGALALERHRRAGRLAAENRALNEANRSLEIENTRLKATLDALTQTNGPAAFDAVARKALTDNARQLAADNSAAVAALLKPMNDQLEAFRRSLADRQEREAAEHSALSSRIRELTATSAAVGLEARRLTDALKGNTKLQGQWGEMILDNILSTTGMRRGIDYVLQESVRTPEGRLLRPDAVINFTDNRKIIIDSKVSIQSYLNMLSADTADQRKAFAAEHVASVRKHVAELRSKNYQEYVGTGVRIDFVLMFIPHEGAYLAAMDADPNLWQNAYDSNVVVISPTHLVSVLRLIEQLWRHDRQNQNALEIARQAGAMLDKFRGFLEDMERMDQALKHSREAWNAAYNKLTAGNGNLLGRANALRELGAKVKKDFPTANPAPEAQN